MVFVLKSVGCWLYARKFTNMLKNNLQLRDKVNGTKRTK